jgi:hypothetical protein
LPPEQPKFEGPLSCRLCHDQKEKADPLLERDFCLLTEWSTFQDDKHSLAFRTLQGELGRKMSQRLGFEVTESRQCLSCHANWQWKVEADKPPYFEAGVTCESCHGPSSLWERPHRDAAWRARSPREKEQLGMVDVRNPLRRATQCFSCHIGNVAEGKVITHAMYAAGHPPLPNIEIETFAAVMPPHWRSIREKGDFEFKQGFVQAGGPAFAKNALADLPQTKAVILAGVMALRESVALAADQAVEAGAAMWPELAVFDCQACHHELRSPGWRQRRGNAVGRPGRPLLPEWPAALVTLGLRHLAQGNEAAYQAQRRTFQEKLGRLHQTLAAKPFGDPNQLHAAARGPGGLIAWLDVLGEELADTAFTEADARRAALYLTSDEIPQDPDFAAARQIAWALRVLLAELELGGRYPDFAARTNAETGDARQAREARDIAAWQQWQAQVRTPAEEKIDRLFDQLELNQRLALKLPAGTQRQITVELPKALNAGAEFDPEWFRKQLVELRRVTGARRAD